LLASDEGRRREEEHPGQDAAAVPLLAGRAPPPPAPGRQAAAAGGVLRGAGRPGEGAVRGARPLRQPPAVPRAPGTGRDRVRLRRLRRPARAAMLRRRLHGGHVGDGAGGPNRLPGTMRTLGPPPDAPGLPDDEPGKDVPRRRPPGRDLMFSPAVFKICVGRCVVNSLA
jgi:hypothetical protein